MCCFGSSKPGKLDVNGPRSCTDVIPLVIFTGFWCVVIFITTFAIVNGNVWRLLNGVDSFGNVCGETNRPIEGLNFSGRDMTSRKFLHAMDIRNPFQSVWICAAKCPDANLRTNAELHAYLKTSDVNFCLYDTANLQDEIINPRTLVGPCPAVVLNSTSVMNRCVPVKLDESLPIGITDKKELATTITNYFGAIDLWEKIIWDLKETWRPILLSCLVAFVASAVLITLLRFCGGAILYVLIGVIVLGVIAATAALWTYYGLLVNNINYEFLDQLRSFVSYSNDRNVVLWSAIGVTLLAVVVVLVVCCFASRAKMLAELFQQAAVFLQDCPCVLLQPLCSLAVLVIFVVVWIFVLLLILSSGETTIVSLASTGPMQVIFKGVQFNRTYMVHAFTAVHIFGLAWMTEFIYACEQMLIAGTVAQWYFSQDKGVASCYICTSLKRLVIYHLGTVAFGSLIIALVKFPRWIIMFISNRFKSSNVPCSETVVKCCAGCMLCIEKCLRYINRNAYTITAIEGSSFCPAAVQAFGILASHPISVSTIKGLGGCVLFLVKIGVVAATVAFGFLTMKDMAHLHSIVVPLVLMAVLAYLIVDCFITIYSTVIDTLFLCFCEDSAMQADADGGDGSKRSVTSKMEVLVQTYGRRRTATERQRIDAGEGGGESEYQMVKL